MFCEQLKQDRIAIMGEFEEYDWFTKDQFKEKFPPFFDEYRHIPILMITLNAKENTAYKDTLEEHGFVLRNDDKGLHGTPIYLWVRKKYQKKGA